MIRTEAEYNRALLDVEYFFNNQDNLNEEEAEKFNMLVNDIVEYESKFLDIELIDNK